MSKRTNNHDVRKATDVDAHVGAMIKARREALSMNQAALAEAVGVAFQMIHKYEVARNRVSASRLWHIAGALDVPVSYFFQGLPCEGREAA